LSNSIRFEIGRVLKETVSWEYIGKVTIRIKRRIRRCLKKIQIYFTSSLLLEIIFFYYTLPVLLFRLSSTLPALDNITGEKRSFTCCYFHLRFLLPKPPQTLPFPQAPEGH